MSADECYFRGSLYHWFEGGPNSLFLDSDIVEYKPADGDFCQPTGR